MTLTLLALSTLLGCPKTVEPVAVEPATRIHNTQPGPLEARPFQLPTVHQGTLSNGIPVAVVENHEVPFVYVRLIFESGSWTDPDTQPGLAAAAMDMLNEGTAQHDAEGLSRALRVLASDLGSSAGLDGAGISLRTLKQNIEPSLDLMAEVALQPSFPEDEWSLIQSRYIQDVRSVGMNPNAIAGRVWRKLMYGEQYAGRLTNEEAYQAMTVGDLQGWYQQHIIPANASILVGGDITLEEVQPLLEARFQDWSAEGELPEQPTGTLPAVDVGTIYLVDMPGAPQSVVRVGQAVGGRQDEDATALSMASMALGGQFTARINMNLREDKGWTYGASSWISHNHYPGMWNVYSSIVTPHTADGVSEILSEVQGMLGEKPITDVELASGKGDILGSWPVRFEQPNFLLDQTVEVQRYELPSDWLSTTPERIRGVTLEQAQQAFSAWINPEKFVILVVGDAASVLEPLQAIGMPVVQLDINGAPMTEDNNGN